MEYCIFHVYRSIDVRMITEVTDLPESEQNEKNSCFNIITRNRTYEIKGINKDEKLRYDRVVPPNILFLFCFLFFQSLLAKFLINAVNIFAAIIPLFWWIPLQG